MTQALHSHEAAHEEIERLAREAARLERDGPRAILEWAFAEFGDSIAIATGFGAEGVVILDIAMKARARPRVFFIDTGFLFPATYDLRRRIERRYGIEIEALRPSLTPEQQEDAFGPNLWQYDPDLCCSIRKLDPLEQLLPDLDAWVTGIRRDQTPARAHARAVEWDRRWQLVKVNPLVGLTRQDVWSYVLQNDVPYNPLHDRGYPSIGCTHCTRAVSSGENERAGRWTGFVKLECGLHTYAAKGGLDNERD